MYKEKYLKYKTKYIALKNQLGGQRPIIMPGYDKSQQPPPAQLAPQPPALPALEKTEIHHQLESGEISLVNYLKNDNLTTMIIINSTNDFYRTNTFFNFSNSRETLLPVKDALIILKKPTSLELNNLILWQDKIIVGLLIDNVKQQIYVLEWNKNKSEQEQNMFIYKNLNQVHIRFLVFEAIYLRKKSLGEKGLEQYKTMLKEFLVTSLQHIKNPNMILPDLKKQLNI